MNALSMIEVTRGIAPPAPRVPSETDVSAISIAGLVVLIDTADYLLDGRSLAAIMRWDGSIGLEYARSCDGRRFAGERSGMFNVVPPRGRAAQSEGCVILGRVISQE